MKRSVSRKPKAGERCITLYFNRWKFGPNIGDSVMLSALFRPIKQVYGPCYLEVVTDNDLVDLFKTDPDVDSVRSATWLEMHLPYVYYQAMARRKIRPPLKNRYRLCVKPSWKARTFAYLAKEGRLAHCIESPNKNILSYNFVLQISDELAEYPDLRPRIYLTDDEIERGQREIGPNAVGINIARMRTGSGRSDGQPYRYGLDRWRSFAGYLKQFDPAIRIVEIGQSTFEGVGDTFLPNADIRTAAARLNAMRIVVLSDGGIHNICNAIDKTVLLFQACECNPPDVFKMGNAIFNPGYHTECRNRCDIFARIHNVAPAELSCDKACYNLDPKKLADDCIEFLRQGR